MQNESCTLEQGLLATSSVLVF